MGPMRGSRRRRGSCTGVSDVFNLNRTKLDPEKLEGGQHWEVLINTADGTLSAQPIPGPHPKNGWLLIAPPGLAYVRAVDEARGAFLREFREGTLSVRQQALIEGRSLVDGLVLRGWGNLCIGSQPLPFSREAAMEILTDPAWQNLRQLVLAIADNRKALLDQMDAEAEGNSSADLRLSSSDNPQVGTDSSSSESLSEERSKDARPQEAGTN